jgi:hypothetical protein
MAKISQDTPVKNLVINQGEDTTIQLNIKESDGTTSTPINISGYTFVCKVRREATDDEVTITASCSILDPVNGAIEVTFHGEDSTSVDVDDGNYDTLSEYTYDVFMTDLTPTTSRILCGNLYISPSVSNR